LPCADVHSISDIQQQQQQQQQQPDCDNIYHNVMRGRAGHTHCRFDLPVRSTMFY
jgi:hypothetical protein